MQHQYTSKTSTYDIIPASTLLETFKALSKSLVKTYAPKPYSVSFALLMTSSMLLNLKICITGPKI